MTTTGSLSEPSMDPSGSPVLSLCGTCGRRYVLTVPEPDPFTCSWCRVRSWEATRLPSVAAVRAKALKWLADHPKHGGDVPGIIARAADKPELPKSEV